MTTRPFTIALVSLSAACGPARSGAPGPAAQREAAPEEPAATDVASVPPGPAPGEGKSCQQPAPAPSCQEGLCRVEPGCFVMGAPRGSYGATHDNVQVQVTLTRPFALGQTEVTNAQWRDLGFDPPRHRRPGDDGACLEDDCPVGNITFFDALAYLNRLSKREGLQPCYVLSGCQGEVGNLYDCASVELDAESVYACEGYRLPSEAEWEYAARAGTASGFYTGSMTEEVFDCHEEPALEPIAWYCHNSDGHAHRVGQKQPNGWGLHDMLGNTFEYCNDLMDRRGYGEGPLVDPPGTLTPGRDLTPAFPEDPAQTRIRVVRGGSKRSVPVVAMASTRHFGAPEGTDSGAGFRVARTLP